MEAVARFNADLENYIPPVNRGELKKKPLGDMNNRSSSFPKRSELSHKCGSDEMKRLKRVQKRTLENKATNTEPDSTDIEHHTGNGTCLGCSKNSKSDIVNSTKEEDIKDLLTSETFSQDSETGRSYWKSVAEETRSALADCLAENDELKGKIEREKHDKEVVLEKLELSHAKLRAVMAMWKKKFHQELMFDSSDED